MFKRPMFLVFAVSLLGLVNGVSAAVLQCDAGEGALQSGWTQVVDGLNSNVAGTGIDVTLATGNAGVIEPRNKGGSGPLADVETDFYFANDEKYSPGSDFILTLGNLTAGVAYRLMSYHSRTDEGDTTIPNVTVAGATNVTVPASIVQNHAVMDNPAEILFTAGAGDVVIRYQGPDGGCDGCQAFFNGFQLEIANPTIQFELASSGGMETVTPAILTVVLINPAEGETYTVEYSVSGGTATGGGVDYTLTPGTLTFEPGETTETISIAIVDDEVAGEDETIIVELSNPTGVGVLLGTAQHTYTISDYQPTVSFAAGSSSGTEDVTPVLIPVNLSYASDETITVEYAVSGGTATGGGVDYTLEAGTLTFDPLVVTQNISITIVDDSTKEDDETISLILSNPTNATLGTPANHTYTITDNEEGVAWEGLRWYYSESPTTLFVNQDGQLEWPPEKDEQFITRLSEQDFSYDGAVVEVSYMWMSDGEGHESHPECEIGCQRKDEGCPCDYDDDIQCLAGTSDMRVGLFEADGEYIEADGFDVYGSSIFEGYKGYGFRFGPHMDSYPTRWLDCQEPEPEVHKTGQFQKKPVSLSNLLSTNDGLSGNDEPIPGFELPPGEFSLFTIRLERLSSSSVELSITLNDRTYTWTDGSSSGQPQKIDVLAVHMRNGRPYSRLVLDNLCELGPTDFYPDAYDVINFRDLDIWSLHWLEDNFVPIGQLAARWELDEGSGTIANDSAGDSNGTLNGDPNWVTGYIGTHALDFNGVEDYVRTGYEDGPSEYSIALWYNLNEDINTSTFGGFRALASKTADEITSVDCWSIWWCTTYGLGLSNEVSQSNYASVVYKPAMFYKNEWHHVAVTGTTTQGKIYFDGDLKNTSNDDFATGAWDDSVPFDIARPYYGTAGRFFNGKIDDVRIYDYELNTEEVMRVYEGLPLEDRFVCAGSPVGDLNADCEVTFSDYADFALHWLDACE